MWACPKCGESVEDGFDVCWNCGTGRDGAEDPDFAPVLADADPGDDPDAPRYAVQTPGAVPVALGYATPNPAPPRRAVDCLRCRTPLAPLGTRTFHEGRRWGATGDLGELFVRREQFELYACPTCGHVELFLPERDASGR